MKQNGNLEIELRSAGRDKTNGALFFSQVHAMAAESGFVLRHNPSQSRSLDPTVITAIVGGSAGALVAFVTGILQVAKERRSSRIILQSSEGARLEVPADTPVELINELVKQLHSMSKPTIFL